jgi:hypothetical protein
MEAIQVLRRRRILYCKYPWKYTLSSKNFTTKTTYNTYLPPILSILHYSINKVQDFSYLKTINCWKDDQSNHPTMVRIMGQRLYQGFLVGSPGAAAAGTTARCCGVRFCCG